METNSQPDPEESSVESYLADVKQKSIRYLGLVIAGTLVLVGCGVTLAAATGDDSTNCEDFMELDIGNRRSVVRQASEIKGLEHPEPRRRGVNDVYLQEITSFCSRADDAWSVDQVTALFACDVSANSCDEAEELVEEFS